MNRQELLHQTSTVLAGSAPKELQPIEKGGSSRCFYRVIFKDNETVILVHDLGEKEENQQYAALAGFLGRYGVPVPSVLAVDHSAGLLWLEDLGENDLWASRNKPWAIRRPLYESVLRGAALLHRIPIEDANELHLQKEFDEHLYRWEQEYFVSHCLGDLFGLSETSQRNLLATPAMKRLASSLASRPRQIVHRDFQSQNIMIRDDEAWFIDFQGMRPGLAQYDLASLLCDPYVTIEIGEREELVAYYRQLLIHEGSGVGDDFERIFWQCAVQRLMQALGAYGFLSLHRGKTPFRAHVSPALARLREALEQLNPDDQLDELAEIVANLNETKS